MEAVAYTALTYVCLAFHLTVSEDIEMYIQQIGRVGLLSYALMAYGSGDL